MSAKLIITRGLPGSGKTTWAKAQKGAVRVNRDDLRRAFDESWDHTSGADEDIVTKVQFVAIGLWLTRGRSVIADDTNFRPEVVKRLEYLAMQHGAEFEIEDFTDVPIETCIARDAARSGVARVGEDVIRGMWQRYLADQHIKP